MKIKTLALVAAALLLGTTAHAQCSMDYEPYPYGFVGLQGGAQLTFTNYNYGKLITPIGGVQIGGQFSPIVGARLHAMGINSKTAAGRKFKPTGETDFKFFTGDIDLMINVTNIFRKKTCCPRLLDAYLIAGVGLNYVRDIDDLPADYTDAAGNVRRPSKAFTWTDNRYSHNFRLGAMVEANVAKHWGVNLEVDMNNLNDRFNAKRGGDHDWQLTAMLGLRYKFGFKKKPAPVVEPVPVPEPVVIPEPEPEPEPVVIPEPEPEPVVVPEPEPEPVVPAFVPEENTVDLFFQMAKTDINPEAASKLRAMGNWLNSRSNARVIVTGYADKGTGKAPRNLALSKQRAEAVADQLVTEYGFDRSKITVDYKGDTVQPYPNENDKNRLVRIEAKTVEE